MSATNTLVDRLRTLAPATGPLGALRRRAFTAFEDLGLPTRRDEDWKYTSVRGLAKADLRVLDAPASDEGVDALVADAALPDETARLVFVDGHYAPHRSSLGDVDGLRIRSIDALDDAALQRVVAIIDADTEAFPDGFAALNAAVARAGVLIEADAEVPGLIHLVHVISTASGERLSGAIHVIEAARHARVRVVETWVGGDDKTTLDTTAVHVRVADGGRVDHVKVQRGGHAGYHIGRTWARVARDATYANLQFTLGTRVSREGTHVSIDGPGAHADLGALFFPRDGQLHDHHTVIDHRAPNATSDQRYQAVLDGNGHGVFNGKIFVQQIAQQTAAEQLNRNLLLSDAGRIDTKPQLEIFADDVRCTHGATIGQIDPEELFYMTSRAIPPSMARELLVRGFGDQVLERAPLDGLRDALSERFAAALR